MIVALCGSDDVLEHPIVRDISSRSPKRYYIDMAVRDSLARYKSVMEAKVPMLRVNVLLDVGSEGYYFTVLLWNLSSMGLRYSKLSFRILRNPWYITNTSPVT